MKARATSMVIGVSKRFQAGAVPHSDLGLALAIVEASTDSSRIDFGEFSTRSTSSNMKKRAFNPAAHYGACAAEIE